MDYINSLFIRSRQTSQFNKNIFNFITWRDSRGMTRKEILKIFFIALITGNIMGIVLIQIFETLTITSLIILEISLIIIIVLLFVASRLWNKRLDKKTKREKENNPA